MTAEKTEEKILESSPERAKEDSAERNIAEAEKIATHFLQHFDEYGAKQVDSVPVSSAIDSTVRFVGSHISVLKNYIESDQLPEKGVYMVQDCVRTRNAKYLLDDEFNPKWGSYFKSLGVLVPAEQLQDLVSSSVQFLVDKLGIDKEDICVRVNSGDVDLFTVAKEVLGEESVEVDTQAESYYRHKIGMENVVGRNFNFAIRGGSGEFSDVGNVIVLEKDDQPHSVELALGVSTILKETDSLEHVLDATPVIGLKTVEGITEAQERKLHDCIVFSVLLFQENMRPIGGDNRNRILKKYTQAMSYFRLQLGLSLEDIYGFLKNAPSNVANSNIAHTAAIITEYLRCYEKSLPTKKQLGKDDKVILDLLTNRA